MIDSRQFLISKKNYSAPDFINIKLKNGFFLSYQKDLFVYINAGYDILLLGIAWQTDPAKSDPVKELRELESKYGEDIPEEAIIAMEELWCGRYVLIIHDRVYLDATGLLGVYYSEVGISSSCRLLADIMGLPSQIYKPAEEFYWLPAPRTHFKEIKRLLPSQVYHLNNGNIYVRRLLASNMPEYKNEEERIKDFVNYFSASLNNMSKIFCNEKILIAITGGYDSRTLLALAKYAGIDFGCFTLEYEDISQGDVEISREICEKLKCEYTYIKREKANFTKKLIKDYEQHTMGLINDQDKLHYAHGQYQELVNRFGKVVLLRSSVWETVTEYYRKYIDNTFNPENAYKMYNTWDTALARESLQEYSKWLQVNKQDSLATCDQFFWEQRNGSWLSAIEQSFDLFDNIISLQPVNSRRMISVLLGFAREDRIIKNHQVKIMSYACPELAEIEFDGYERMGIANFIKKEWEKGIHRVKDLGLQKTIKLYLKIIRIKKEEQNAKKAAKSQK